MDEKKEKVCPFTPMLTPTMKWVTCIKGKCMLWDGKRKTCGLKQK